MRIKKAPPGVPEADLTPMIDMTFQLIAFFMVLINFSQAEQTEMIKLPSSALAKAPEEQPEHRIVLNLLKDGKVLFGGQTYDTISSLGIKLDQERQYREDQGADTITVIIRAHEAAQTGAVQELIKECQDNGLDTFALRVKEEVSS